VRSIRAGADTASAISTDGKRKEEKEKNMARRKLTEREMLKGVEKALASKKCPPQLKPGLQRRAGNLRKKLGLDPRAGHLGLFQAPRG
jgi:hypothetical protein